MDKIREQIYLAALLHDIGKFYQRADTGIREKDNELSGDSLKIAEDICPINQTGTFGYQHVIWANEFFAKQKKVFEKIPGTKVNLYNTKQPEDSLVNFACNHHKPFTELQAIITMADWWSAGIDRTEIKTLEVEEKISEKNIKWGKSRYKNIPLYSVFNRINDGTFKSAFKLNPLSIEKEFFFPIHIAQPTDGVNQSQYNNLWTQFINEFNKLPTHSYHSFSESLLFLLKKYTWCIPSNTMDMANISLYDHLRITAAFADCLYLYKQENPSAFYWNSSQRRLFLNEKETPVLLLGGDISGIQKFIYNIASSKAAVSLKGRSFYLQLLVDSVIQRIISHEDINCSIGQVVFSSGGKFYMLLPNTSKVRKAIESLEKDFEKELWDEHFGQIALNLDYIPFAYVYNSPNKLYFENTYNSIGQLWKRLADKLTERKNKKFISQLIEEYEQLFVPKSVTNEDRVCAVTGIEGKCVKLNKDSDVYVLPIVKKQADMGNKLKNVDYILTHKIGEKSFYLSNRTQCDMAIVQTYNYLYNQQELIKENNSFFKISSADNNRVKMVNKLNFLDAQIKGQDVSYGFQFYGGNVQAQNADNRNKTFEELADNAYLGVLRMDVDNLGAVFVKGLDERERSFSAYSTLSFMLDYFFSGYINTIRSDKEFEDFVNIIYSGGDDIFAVGRWDKLILFAERIRKDFEKFVGRSDITISAGISLVTKNFPIIKAAILAKKAEDNAKSFNNHEKNAFNLFGKNISWKEEFDFVKKYKEQFVALCIDKNINMPYSILHRLMLLYKQKELGNPSYLWHTAYFLKRFSEKNKKEEIIELCEELNKILFVNRNFELMAIAARWAELELKFNHKISNIIINN